jgi:hypothetical protein
MLKRIAIACVYPLIVATAALSATKPITDESLRMDALRVAFPNSTISLAVGRSIDDSWRPTGHSKEFLFPEAAILDGSLWLQERSAGWKTTHFIEIHNPI